MKKRQILFLLVFSLCFVLCACGVKVSQNVSAIEVGSQQIDWAKCITVENVEKYDMSFDASMVDLQTVGKYEVVYIFRDKETGKLETKNVAFTVQDTTPPEIKARNNTTRVEQGDEYDLRSLVTVSDNYDTLGVDALEVTGDIDNMTIGSYEISYAVADTAGNKANLNLIVSVVEKIPEIKDKEIVLIDDVGEFYVDFAKISTKVLPPTPKGFYSYYAADQGKVFVDLCLNYKNLATDDVEVYDIGDGLLIYDEKYNYSCFATVEEGNRRDFTFASISQIKPLTKEYVHYLFEVPDEVANGSGSIVIELDMSGHKYKYVVR